MTDTDGPIRVSERVVSAYQWDLWREAVLRGSRRSEVLAIVLGLLVGIGAGGLGYGVLDGDARLSAFVYAPIVGAGVWFWSRSWLAMRQLSRVTEDVRPVVVPTLVRRVTDQQLVSMLRNGGALVGEESTVILTERRGAAFALVASEYEPRRLPIFAPDAGGG